MAAKKAVKRAVKKTARKPAKKTTRKAAPKKKVDPLDAVENEETRQQVKVLFDLIEYGAQKAAAYRGAKRPANFDYHGLYGLAYDDYVSSARRWAFGGACGDSWKELIICHLTKMNDRRLLLATLKDHPLLAFAKAAYKASEKGDFCTDGEQEFCISVIGFAEKYVTVKT